MKAVPTKKAAAAEARAKRAKAAPAAQPGRGRRRARTALLAAGLALAVLLTLAVVLAVYVSGTDTIYPRLSLGGVDLGGLTKAEATEALLDAGWETPEGAAVTFLLPLEQRLTVTAEEAGAVRLSAAEAAIAAYDHCHGGNLIENLCAWLRCVTAGAELDPPFAANEAVVRARVDAAVAEVTQALMTSGAEIGETEIVVVKGAKAVDIDAEALAAAVIEALERADYGERTFEVAVDEAVELDVDGLYETVHREAADARYDAETGEVVPAVVGLDFDRDEARRLWEAADYGETIRIPIARTEPALSTEDVGAMLFADELGRVTTSLAGSSANRINNVKLACEAIDGLELRPGAVFSYNEALGERTAARGYKPAGAYSGGEVVQEIGGGICQVSSGLYYAALLANLKITTRSCHYFGVAYLPPGLDATVSWGGPEFKFQNDRDWPLRFAASVDETDNTVTISIYGTDVDGSYVEMTYATWLVYNDAEYPEVATGYKAATYRWVYDKDGNQLSKELEAYSEYHYHEEDIRYPEPSPSASPSPSPSAPPEASPSAPPTEPPATEPPAEPTAPVADPTPDPTPGTEG